MPRLHKIIPIALILAVAACENAPTSYNSVGGQVSLRVVNAFTAPVDVIIDGSVAISSLAAGSVGTASSAAGNHTVVLRPTSTGASASQSMTMADGATSTLAVVRAADGSAGVAVLDDTGSVVPAGSTKVRVLHLAPNAGTLQVYRTQPDYQQPVQWQFPFNYQASPTPLSAPFVQSTVGTWEIRVWKAPADASGWTTATVKVLIPLQSGEKKTVLILDDVGGGVKIQVI